MKLLFLAPQPFFQERGTPIAVRLALQVIAARLQENSTPSQKIDLLTYHVGNPIEIPGVNIHRIKPFSFLNAYLSKIGAGVSLKKLVCDVFFTFKTFQLIWVNRRDQYQVIHAVEESVFIALLIKIIFGIPYIYDMDSSLALQVTEKWTALKPFDAFFNWFEKMAIKNSMAVAPVCDALGVIAQKHGASHTFIVRDISLLNGNQSQGAAVLKEELMLKDSDQIILYVGNLESYQGIDLLLESFATVVKNHPSSHVVVIGGSSDQIKFYKNKSQDLAISSQVHLIGARPLEHLEHYIVQADILASPRIKGNNTPMKIYSYMHSGKPVLATNLPTHTQVLNDSVAMLVEPTVEGFSRGLSELLESSDLRAKIGQNAFKLAEENYTFSSFSNQLNLLYDQIGLMLNPSPDYSKI